MDTEPSLPTPIPRSDLQSFACRASALYALAAFGWVQFSDRFVRSIAGSNDALEDHLRIYERWGFIAITATLLFFLLKKHSEREQTRQRERDADVLQRNQLEQHFAKLNAITPNVIYTFRIGADGRVTFPFANRKIEDFLPVSAESLALDGTLAITAIHEEDRALFMAAVEESRLALTPYCQEFRICHPQRGVIWIEAHSMPERESTGGTLWYGFFRDVTRRKIAEARLRESEGLFRSVTEQSTDAIFVKDRDCRYLLFNKAGADYVGRPLEEILGKRANEIFEAECAARIDARDKQVMETGEVLTHEETITSNGSERIFYGMKAPYRDSAGKIIGTIGIWRDITERKRAQEAMRLNEERLRLAADAAWLGTWDWDIRIDRVHWSSQVWAFFGVEPDSTKLNFDFFKSAIHPEDRERVVKNVDASLKDDAPYATEFRVVQPSGQIVWLNAVGRVFRDAGGDPVRMVGIHLNITDRKKSEAALRASEQLHRTVVTTLAEGIVLQHRDGRITASNPAAEKILGLSADHLEGRTSLDPRWHVIREDGSPFPGDEHPAMLVLRTGEPQIGVVMGVHRADGSLVWISINARPIIDEATSTVVSAVTSFTDITARKQAETMAKQHRAVLEMIATGSPLEATLDALLRLIEDQCSEMFCSVQLLDPDGLHLRHAAGPRIPTTYSAAIDGLAIGPDVGCCGTAAFRREVVFVEDIATHPLWAKYRHLALAHEFRACWSTPILSRDRSVLGTFAIYFQKPALPGEIHVQLINLATHTASIAINRHQAEAALHASESRYRQLIDTLPVAVYTTDADGYLTLFNEAAEKLWGRTPEIGVDRWSGEHSLFNANGALLPPYESPMASALRDRQPARGAELAADSPDGRRVHFLAYSDPIVAEDGTLAGAMNVLVDITEQRLSARAVRLWADAFQHCALGMSVGNTSTDLILACNPALAKMLRRDVSQIAGLPVVDIYAPSSRTEIAEALVEADREGSTQFEATMRRADDSTFTAQVDIVTVRDDSGEPAYRIFTAQDITLRQIAADDLQKAYDELQRAQGLVLQQERLSAFGQMARGVAHDINNAICPVSIYSTVLLKSEPGLSPRTREYLEIIQRAAKGVGDTVSRLRKFSRGREDPGVLAPMLVSDLVEEVTVLTRACWQDLAQERGAEIVLKTEIAPGLPPIAGIVSEVAEALINLVFNAVDAMPDGGTLTIRAYASADDPSVCIEVADSGLGMSDEARRRCLEPFYTTKGELGTGLGLSIVNGILQRHKAGMQIESTPGVGTTIRCVFPSASDRLPAKRQQEEPVAVPPMKILVTDDDPRILGAMRIILTTYGHDAECVNGGQAALDAFHVSLKNGKPFDVVITDLGMPKVDGRAVAANVKAASPGTPVILLTGWGQALQEDADIPPGVDHILAKPVSPHDLFAVLAVCRAQVLATKTDAPQ